MPLKYEIYHLIYLQKRCLPGTNWSPQLPTAISDSNCQSLRFTQIITLSQVSIWTAVMWFFTATFFENMRWHWTQLELFYQSISFNIFVTIIAIHWCFHHVLHQYVLIKIALNYWFVILFIFSRDVFKSLGWTGGRQIRFDMLGVGS